MSLENGRLNQRRDNYGKQSYGDAVKLTKDNYVEVAKAAIDNLKNSEEKKLVTTTKIRGLLSLLADIYNEVQQGKEDTLNERVNYLKVRFLYEAGRESTVKKFVNTAHILDYINSIKGEKSEFILFYHYMEALIAYFKFYGLDKE